MSLEIWCYIFAGGLMALFALQFLALGREAVLLDAARAKAELLAAAKRRAALIAAIEMADSDVMAVED